MSGCQEGGDWAGDRCVVWRGAQDPGADRLQPWWEAPPAPQLPQGRLVPSEGSAGQAGLAAQWWSPAALPADFKASHLVSQHLISSAGRQPRG